MAKKRMSLKKRQKVKETILIIAVVILGLGAIGITGKLLDDKYQWVEQLKDKFAKPEEDTSITEDVSIPVTSEAA